MAKDGLVRNRVASFLPSSTQRLAGVIACTECALVPSMTEPSAIVSPGSSTSRIWRDPAGSR
jgi:hypothetical protein